MKAFLFAATAAATLFAATPAHAGGCDSLTSGTAKIWKDWAQVVKGAGCAVATVASEGAVPFPKCLEEANKYDQATQDMIKKWNDSAHNGSGSIGPRLIDYNETQKGKLVSFGERVFVSPAPFRTDKARITIKKRDGKAAARITVCKEDPDTNRHQVWTFEADNGEGNKGKEWTKELGDLRGHVLTIHLASLNAINAFEYDLTVEVPKAEEGGKGQDEEQGGGKGQGKGGGKGQGQGKGGGKGHGKGGGKK